MSPTPALGRNKTTSLGPHKDSSPPMANESRRRGRHAAARDAAQHAPHAPRAQWAAPSSRRGAAQAQEEPAPGLTSSSAGPAAGGLAGGNGREGQDVARDQPAAPPPPPPASIYYAAADPVATSGPSARPATGPSETRVPASNRQGPLASSRGAGSARATCAFPLYYEAPIGGISVVWYRSYDPDSAEHMLHQGDTS